MNEFNDLNEVYNKYQRALNKLPLEARAIVFAFTAIFIFTVWYYGLWSGLRSKNSRTNEVPQLELSISQLKAEIEAAQKEFESESLQKNKVKKTFQAEVSKLSAVLISSQKVDQALQDLLTNNRHLTLVSLHHMPAKKMSSTETNVEIFEHDIVVKFRGDYFSTIKYLQAVESLNWHIFWDKLEYNVIPDAQAEIVLYIHTIGNKED